MICKHSATAASLRLPRILADHMVIQRDQPVRLWGWDRPGQIVRVMLGDARAEQAADATGRWLVTLPAMPAGGPHTISIEGSQRIAIKDVLVGDVWVCSGQSNMEWLLKNTVDAEATLQTADDGQLRLFTVAKVNAEAPSEDVTGEWCRCDPQTAESFSGVGYHFGRELRLALNIPIGLIHSSWGGTTAEAWTSQEALCREPQLAHMGMSATGMAAQARLRLADQETRAGRRLEADVQIRPDGSMPDPGRQAFADNWESPGYEDAHWDCMEVPDTWESTGLHINGAVWFRRILDVPAAWAGRDLRLNLGAVDDFDITFFNGQQVGSTGTETRAWWIAPRSYLVPGKLVKAGRNVIAVRVFDQFMRGGLVGPANAMLALPVDALNSETPIRLAGRWKYQVEIAKIDLGAANVSSMLFNGMIHPLVKGAIKGVIWYQGESNASRAEEYRTLQPAMIRDWRCHWGVGDFPFYLVQLANYDPSKAVCPEPSESTWAELREAQHLTTLKVEHCGMAVAIDIGDANDIHPRNKREVGRRLALQALRKTYQQRVVADGPALESWHVVDGRAILKFNCDGSSLCATDAQPLRGFAIAGGDGRFAWADAVIIDDATVALSSPKVAAPARVRYAWADAPFCNLGSKAGLPATPFQSRLDNCSTSTRRPSESRAAS